MSAFTTKLFTSLFGKYVGQDEYGNIYYCSVTNPKKRWVAYKDVPEPSSVPAEWHGWLHNITDEVPSQTRYKRYRWQKKHSPNMTGTNQAYFPPGHELGGGKRKKATGDYTPWKPKSSEEK